MLEQWSKQVRKMAKYGGKVILKAYAKGDINASGPVLLRLEVENAGK